MLPAKMPSAPAMEAPAITNGTVPAVARPQLNSVEKCARPSVLNTALAMNSAPKKTNSGDSQRQKKTISATKQFLAVLIT